MACSSFSRQSGRGVSRPVLSGGRDDMLGDTTCDDSRYPLQEAMAGITRTAEAATARKEAWDAAWAVEEDEAARASEAAEAGMGNARHELHAAQVASGG